MSHPFKHPAAKSLLNRVAHLFQSDGTYVARDSNIVFVCGGPYKVVTTMRRRFMDYSEREIPNLRMFLAENAEKDYVTHEEPEFHNVAEFENLIGEVSDCVIIFPESAGSFAELGYFANIESVRKITLVVHDANLQSDDSFILRGPVDLFDRHSDFRKVIHVDYTDPNMNLIRDRLLKRIPGKQRKRFGNKLYKNLSFKEKFFIVFSLIEIFIYINVEGIEYAFKSIFKHASRNDINHIVSILVAARLIERHPREREHFQVLQHRPFMEFESHDPAAFRLQILAFYSEHDPQLAALAEGAAS